MAGKTKSFKIGSSVKTGRSTPVSQARYRIGTVVEQVPKPRRVDTKKGKKKK